MKKLLVTLVTLVLLAAACGGGSESTTTTEGVGDTRTTTSLASATSTIAATTTTVTTETTTTSPAPTTTTTASPATTTTTAVAATVELSDEGIQAGTEWVYFGFDDEAAIAAVADVLGAPDNDSGWIDSFSVYGTCPGSDIRGVHWGEFVMLFTHADTDFWSGGVPHFFAYYYTDATPDLLTTEGIGIGSSVEMLEAAYGGPSYTMDEAFFDPSLGFWTYDKNMWTGLWGFSTGQTGAHAVTSINGGLGCGE